jgi:hypothetical protein
MITALRHVAFDRITHPEAFSVLRLALQHESDAALRYPAAGLYAPATDAPVSVQVSI